MKNNKIAICVLLFGCFSLTACGLKGKPKPECDSEVLYSGTYPKPLDCPCEEKKVEEQQTSAEVDID